MIYTEPGDFVAEQVAKEMERQSPPLAQKIESLIVSGGDLGAPFRIAVKVEKVEPVFTVSYHSTVGEAARSVLSGLWVAVWAKRKEAGLVNA